MYMIAKRVNFSRRLNTALDVFLDNDEIGIQVNSLNLKSCGKPS